MCGRYVPPDEAEIERLWRIERRDWRGWIVPAFNVAPTMEVPIIVRAADGALELAGARWGLVPPWWKKPVPPSLTFNARSEEAWDKPTWRQSLRAQRCLLPARGWYEWNENETVRAASGRLVRQPYFLHCPNEAVIAFAGLWARWTDPAGREALTCALLSREAVPAISAIHHRMPVVLRPEHYDRWLDPDTVRDEVNRLIAEPRDDLAGWRVSTRVNSVRNNDATLMQPLPDDAPQVAAAANDEPDTADKADAGQTRLW